MNPRLPAPLRSFTHFWWLLGAFIVAFVVYVGAEKNIDRSHETRLQTMLLAHELRQSSDDLTRMVPTYVVTRDPAYKQRYQDILDIRNGKLPRPQQYEGIYWELMRQAGFTTEEFAELDQAIAMLHDAAYHQAKAEIMRPIGAFYHMADQRTLQSVRVAERYAMQVRLALIVCGLGLLLLLWRTRQNLYATLTVRARLLEDGPDGVLLRWDVADTGIGIDSQVGQGSTFWFTVRLGQATDASAVAPAPTSVQSPHLPIE